MQLFNILQNDVEPLPEPWRTVLLVLFLLGALVIPLLSCSIVTVRRRITRRRVEEMGSSWKDLDGQIQKTEDAMISNVQCIAIVILIGIIWFITKPPKEAPDSLYPSLFPESGTAGQL